MISRWITLIVLGLALSACSDLGFTAPSREFSGVLLYQFEGSHFVEGETGIPVERPSYRESDWLDWLEWPALEGMMKENVPEIRRLEDECQAIQPFLVKFVGRRTHRPFGAGHLGLNGSEVMVERPISAKRLGPPFCYERYRQPSEKPSP